ncbi:diuretic hormone class 2-like [Pseudomyrmex gracilis]|uniref:diuretic hormone class 2-like n=1 Tax=Pseudomyrmex gracilis TaxID=219809 RepID=UPI00099503D0|nr:diuretic hormone class 2-like [Pseudomyrmex gracilis]
MQPKVTALCTLLAFAAFVVISSPTVDAIPHSRETYWDQQDDIDRDELLEILSRLSHTVVNRPEIENTKRSDMGLGRSFAATQALRKYMGLSSADYFGRRRRSEQA